MSALFTARLLLCVSITLGALIATTAAIAQTSSSEPPFCQVISLLPAQITASGVYCLTEDLTSPSTAIEVLADDVVIDCNHHKINGGPSGVGIVFNEGSDRTTIRRCTIHANGAFAGIELRGGDGHVIEDNLVERGRGRGITVGPEPSSGTVIRRNRVLRTGALNDPVSSIHGIGVAGADARVEDNEVSIVGGPPAAAANVSGIALLGTGHAARGNIVTDILTEGASAISGGHVIRDNFVMNPVQRVGVGIKSPFAVCRSNEVRNFGIGLDCTSEGGTVSDNIVIF
jgi:Right handed beta helix region